MDLSGLQRSMRISAIAIIITIANVMRLQMNDHIRMVTALSLITLGAAIGVFLVSFSLYRKLKNNS